MHKILIDDAIPGIDGRLDANFRKEFFNWRDLNRDLLEKVRPEALLVRTRNKITKELIEGTAVEFLATATIGTDHIDVEGIRALGVEVANAPGCNTPGVAQYVWSALLRCGFDPARHTLGVVGKGHIGSIVTRWGRLLGARVLVCDPPRRESGFTDEDYRELTEMAGECDALSFHVPKTASGAHPTLGLCGTDVIGRLPEGSILVNASRGGIVDEEALLRAIDGKGVKAVIDTWQGEPSVNPELLRKAVYATPHIAGYSFEGKQRATRQVLERLGAHFGVEIDLTGLAGEYVVPESLCAEEIVGSYDPAADTCLLREDPGNLEDVRCAYNLRKEVRHG